MSTKSKERKKTTFLPNNSIHWLMDEYERKYDVNKTQKKNIHIKYDVYDVKYMSKNHFS
jgi:CRISPR/Cas system CSM-associated protein Csm4 (group 5 of RAMP superfamily)